MLIDAIKTYIEGIPADLKEKKGIYSFEFVVAERKAFLSKKRLTYCAKFRIDDQTRELRFTEMLSESGSGVSGGDGGFGLKTETYKSGTRGREGTIDEQSSVFGKRYDYSLDFKTVRAFFEKTAAQEGYAFTYQLTSKGL